jgi:Ala-tRNA(Pro) deacylase
MQERIARGVAMLTTPPTPRQGALPALIDWLREHGIEHEVHEHAQTFTARQTAHAEGVDPRTFAKVVGVRTEDDRTFLLVLDATDQVDIIKARHALLAREIRLLTEAQLVALAPDCEAGAIPAVGVLFHVPMVADFAVREDRDISFNAGSHRFSVRVDRKAWEVATEVRYADVALESENRPAWARS